MFLTELKIFLMKHLIKPNPINVYGLSKLKGEEALKKYNPNIISSGQAGYMDIKGKNFVEVMLYLASVMPELKVVSDQTGCPTWTMDLAME